MNHGLIAANGRPRGLPALPLSRTSVVWRFVSRDSEMVQAGETAISVWIRRDKFPSIEPYPRWQQWVEIPCLFPQVTSRIETHINWCSCM
jgi:hypothetical protein